MRSSLTRSPAIVCPIEKIHMYQYDRTKNSSDLYSSLGYFRDKTSFILDGRKYNIIEIDQLLSDQLYILLALYSTTI